MEHASRRNSRSQAIPCPRRRGRVARRGVSESQSRRPDNRLPRPLHHQASQFLTRPHDERAASRNHNSPARQDRMGLQKDRRGGKSDYTGECPAREGYDPLMGSLTATNRGAVKAVWPSGPMASTRNPVVTDQTLRPRRRSTVTRLCGCGASYLDEPRVMWRTPKPRPRRPPDFASTAGCSSISTTDRPARPAASAALAPAGPAPTTIRSAVRIIRCRATHHHSLANRSDAGLPQNPVHIDGAFLTDAYEAESAAWGLPRGLRRMAR